MTTQYIAYKHEKLELVVSSFAYPVCSLIHKTTVSSKPTFGLSIEI